MGKFSKKNLLEGIFDEDKENTKEISKMKVDKSKKAYSRKGKFKHSEYNY
jgi:hypothetical protein